MKTVIFDFDGTLADSLDVIIGVFEQLTGKSTGLSKEEMAALRHQPIPLVAKRLGIPMWRVPFLLYEGRRMMARHMDEIHPFAGLPQVLDSLHAEGYRLLVVSSNSTHNVRRFLRHYQLDKYFTHLYGGIGLFSKTAALRKILQRNRVQVEGCVYIGDETRDIEACQALGLRCIAVEWGFANPKFLAAHRPYAMVKTTDELHAVITRSFP